MYTMFASAMAAALLTGGVIAHPEITVSAVMAACSILLGWLAVEDVRQGRPGQGAILSVIALACLGNAMFIMAIYIFLPKPV